MRWEEKAGERDREREKDGETERERERDGERDRASELLTQNLNTEDHYDMTERENPLSEQQTHNTWSVEPNLRQPCYFHKALKGSILLFCQRFLHNLTSKNVLKVI